MVINYAAYFSTIIEEPATILVVTKAVTKQGKPGADPDSAATVSWRRRAMMEIATNWNRSAWWQHFLVFERGIMLKRGNCSYLLTRKLMH